MEKFVLILEEGPQSNEGSSLDALDFQVNNSLIKVSFYDRGMQLPAAKPPVEVYTDCVDIIEDIETNIEEWCINAQAAGSGKPNKRPQTARVLHVLVVEEEIAEIVPYDEKATILQVMHATISLSYTYTNS